MCVWCAHGVHGSCVFVHCAHTRMCVCAYRIICCKWSWAEYSYRSPHTVCTFPSYTPPPVIVIPSCSWITYSVALGNGRQQQARVSEHACFVTVSVITACENSVNV
jgi:hypothetical protein